MTTHVISVLPDLSVAEAARVLSRHRSGTVPVVRREVVVGMSAAPIRYG